MALPKRKPRKAPAAVEVAPDIEPTDPDTATDTEADGVLPEPEAKPAKPTQPASRGYDYDRGF